MNQAANKKIKYWRSAYPVDLAKHFIKFDKEQFQYRRLSCLQLSKSDFDLLFPAEKADITFDFSIMLGLDKKQSDENEFTFRPIISVQYNTTDEVFTADFEYLETSSYIAFDEKVPETFKKWLTANWMSLDVNKLDDSFTSYFIEEKGAPAVEPPKYLTNRLLGYYFTKKINPTFWKFMNKYRNRIEKFLFHLGVDFNKLNQSERFTFSPVFEIHLNELAADHSDIFLMCKWGLRVYPLGKSGAVVYYEYMSPCPPTCKE